MGTPQSGKLSILEIVARLEELSERYGEESEGGKDLDLCRDLDLFVTIFWSMRKLSISRVRVFRSNLLLTDKDSTFIINLTEDEDNPGDLLAIYENLQLRGPGCSEVGEDAPRNAPIAAKPYVRCKYNKDVRQFNQFMSDGLTGRDYSSLR